MRVVTLLPSATEMVAALGCVDWIVGRSHECDEPASIAERPALTSLRFDVACCSGEIDQQVRKTLETYESVYAVNVAMLRELKPDVIVTQDHCEVCAVSLREVEEAIYGFESKPIVVSLNASSLEGMFDDLRKVACALQRESQGDRLIAQYRNHLAALAMKVEGRDKPRVVTIEWSNPLMVGGNWIPELVHIAGGVDVLAQQGEHSPVVQWDQIRQVDPDVFVLLPCGYDLSATLADSEVLKAHPCQGTRSLTRLANPNPYEWGSRWSGVHG